MVNNDFLSHLGILALGSRLKRTSDELVKQVEEVYRDRGLNLSPRVFPALTFLSQQNGAVPITAISEALRISHPAAVQAVEILKTDKLVTIQVSDADERKRLVSLSAQGRKAASLLEPVWRDLRIALELLGKEHAPTLLSDLSSIDLALKQKSLNDRMKTSMERDSVEIIRWHPDYKKAFYDLNAAWIIEYCSGLEESDFLQLEQPEKFILKGKGMIFFAKVGGAVVGTCAVLDHKEKFELCKMAVSPIVQGKGLGKNLLNEAIKYCKESGAKSIVLESARKLTAAIALYRKFGFKEIEVVSKYKRVDIAMELKLDKTSS